MSEDKVTTVSVQIVRNGKGVDVKASLAKASEALQAYAEADEKAMEAVIATSNEILNDEKYAETKFYTASTLAKMVLGRLGEVPTDQVCKEAEGRVRSFLKGETDKYLHIPLGRNAGFHIRARYTEEDLAKLTPKKTATPAAA